MGRIIITIFFFLLACSSQSWALDQIIRPYQSTRSAGMGGVRISTGLYDENFFNNPARVTANPESKFTLLDLMPIETSASTISSIKTILGNSNPISAIASTAGSNLHYRAQAIIPAYYRAAIEDRKFALAIGLIAGLQVDSILRQSYQLGLGILTDVSPTITLGRKLLSDDALSIGLSVRLNYRMGSEPTYSLLNYFQGQSLPLTSLTSDGSMINGDFGLTYRITKIWDFDLTAAGAIQNVMGGTYSPTLFSLFKQGSPPPAQARSYGVGFSLSRAEWGKFGLTSFAIEATDVLNNPNGSVFKMLHVGAETRWKSLILRAGLNQGYWTAGFGLDAHYITLNLATYGEEMGFNTGDLEDRRYAINLGLHI